MNDFFSSSFDPNDSSLSDSSVDPTLNMDWGESLNMELERQRQLASEKVPKFPTTPSPVYKPKSVSRTSTPKLTDDQIKRYIEAKCWINGTYLDSLDTEYLVNCKKFASQRLYNKWYWKFFLNLVNEEILNRDVAIGPKRYYPGTENIPRRGDNNGYGYRSARYRDRYQ